MRVVSNHGYYLSKTQCIHRVAGINGLATFINSDCCRVVLLYCKILYDIYHISIYLDPPVVLLSETCHSFLVQKLTCHEHSVTHVGTLLSFLHIGLLLKCNHHLHQQVSLILLLSIGRLASFIYHAGLVSLTLAGFCFMPT